MTFVPASWVVVGDNHDYYGDGVDDNHDDYHYGGNVEK